jgi:hemolysin III
MHVAGLAFAVVGMVLLTSKADGLPRLQSASVWIYGVGLVTTFATSAAYNIWPVSSAKLILRRFDQAAIFLFIAASYTPFIAHAQQTRKFCSDNRDHLSLVVVIWAAAWIGATLKLACPGRFERFHRAVFSVGREWVGAVRWT